MPDARHTPAPKGEGCVIYRTTGNIDRRSLDAITGQTSARSGACLPSGSSISWFQPHLLSRLPRRVVLLDSQGAVACCDVAHARRRFHDTTSGRTTAKPRVGIPTSIRHSSATLMFSCSGS
jgi:hypothetical protein